MVIPWIFYQEIIEDADMGDLEFLRDKELAGDLVHLISSEFTTNADQVTFVPAAGKTFFHIKSKLYPVVNAAAPVYVVNTTTVTNRRADVELTFDSVLKDALTFDFEAIVSDSGGTGPGAAAQTGQFETNIFESMVGDGIKSIKLTSTNNSGTYRVSLLGWIQDT